MLIEKSSMQYVYVHLLAQPLNMYLFVLLQHLIIFVNKCVFIPTYEDMLFIAITNSKLFSSALTFNLYY